jgi:hypothetical protein
MLPKLLGAGVLVAGVACSPRQNIRPPPQPPIIPHSAWQTQPPLGYSAEATRRNLAEGRSLPFNGFTITVVQVGQSAAVNVNVPKRDFARLRLTRGTTTEERIAFEGSAFNWNGFHVAVVAIYGPGELGAGLVALEIATVASLPPRVASSDSAGRADMRLRIAHKIMHVTLHHTGDARPLMPGEDPVRRLRGLQSWGATDRNWWDVPYHYLLGVDGSIFEGRDWHYMGETNTSYNPGGHFLISAIGNYEIQEATPATLAAIADLMAWALKKFDLPLSVIGGHYNYAQTGCPGKHLRKYLEDGTLKRMVAQRLK